MDMGCYWNVELWLRSTHSGSSLNCNYADPLHMLELLNYYLNLAMSSQYFRSYYLFVSIIVSWHEKTLWINIFSFRFTFFCTFFIFKYPVALWLQAVWFTRPVMTVYLSNFTDSTTVLFAFRTLSVWNFSVFYSIKIKLEMAITWFLEAIYQNQW